MVVITMMVTVIMVVIRYRHSARYGSFLWDSIDPWALEAHSLVRSRGGGYGTQITKNGTIYGFEGLSTNQPTRGYGTRDLVICVRARAPETREPMPKALPRSACIPIYVHCPAFAYSPWWPSVCKANVDVRGHAVRRAGRAR